MADAEETTVKVIFPPLLDLERKLIEAAKAWKLNEDACNIAFLAHHTAKHRRLNDERIRLQRLMYDIATKILETNDDGNV